MKFKAKFYCDIEASDMANAEFKANLFREIADRNDSGIHNFDLGGIVRLIDGDLMGNAERLEKI